MTDLLLDMGSMAFLAIMCAALGFAIDAWGQK